MNLRTPSRAAGTMGPTNSIRRHAPVLFAVVALVLGSSLAHADPILPGAMSTDFITTTTSADVTQSFGCGPFVPCAGINSISADGGVATNMGSPVPESIATVSGSNDSVSVNAFLVYSIEVIGPGSGVLIDIASSAFSSGSGLFSASTLGEAQDTNGFLLFGKTCAASGVGCGGAAGSPSAAPVSLSMLATVGVIDTITLTTEVSAGPGSTVEAFLDPTITIDPSTPDPQDFQIFTSPGVANPVSSGTLPTPTSVPEPTSILLFGSALGWLGWMRLRKALLA